MHVYTAPKSICARLWVWLHVDIMVRCSAHGPDTYWLLQQPRNLVCQKYLVTVLENKSAIQNGVHLYLA